MTDRRRSTIMLGLAIIAALLLAGCSGAPRTAIAAHTADASLAAAETVLSDPAAAGLASPTELTEEQAEQLRAIADRVLRQIGGARTLLQPVRHYLDPADEEQPAATAEGQLALPDDTYDQMIHHVTAEARQEAESRVWWRRLVAGWAQAAGTWSLSLLGLGGAAGGIAGGIALARRWIRRGRALADAVGFGDALRGWLRDPRVPPEVRAAAETGVRLHAQRQEDRGTREEIRRQRQPKPKPYIEPVAVTPRQRPTDGSDG